MCAVTCPEAGRFNLSLSLWDKDRYKILHVLVTALVSYKALSIYKVRPLQLFLLISVIAVV